MKIIHYIEDQYHHYIQLQNIGRWQNLDRAKMGSPPKTTIPNLFSFSEIQGLIWSRPMQVLSTAYVFRLHVPVCRSWIYRVNFILHEIVSISAWNYTGFKANNYDYYIPLIAHSNN